MKEIKKQEIIQFEPHQKLIEEIKILRKRLGSLIVERDRILLKENKELEAVYIRTLGYLEFKIYELQCSIRRIRRKTELIRSRLNRQEKISIAEIENILDQEFYEYERQINEHIKSLNKALEREKLKFLSVEETKELKELYYTLVKILHPDLNPNLTQEQKNLFNHVVSAYETGDLPLMHLLAASITEPVKNLPSDDKIKELIKEKERLEQLIGETEEDIEKIKSSFPYSVKPLLADKKLVSQKKSEYKKIISELERTKKLALEHMENLL